MALTKAATVYTFEQLVDAFNKQVNLDFGKILESISSDGAAIIKEYNVDPAAQVNYPFGEFVAGLEEFTGTMSYQDATKAFNFTIDNAEYAKGYKVKSIDFERARSLKGLNQFQDNINQLQTRARDHSTERAMTLLIAGAASTYGTCFDGQNLFDTTHSYTNVAGTQDNIVSGTGVTMATVQADILSAIQKFAGFYWTGTDGEMRLLNSNVTKIDIVCPPEMYSVFLQLKSGMAISSVAANIVSGYIGNIIVKKMTDLNNWFVINSNTTHKPIIVQVEKPLEFTYSDTKSEAYRKNRLMEYEVYTSKGIAYGAWWTAVSVTNA